VPVRVASAPLRTAAVVAPDAIELVEAGSGSGDMREPFEASRAPPQGVAPPDTRAAPALAAPVARQIAQALTDAGRDAGVPLDLALDPPELGRVRLSFTEANGTLTLAIAVERPETAELMRRHITLLSEEFARAGLDAPSVNISQDGADGRQAPRAPLAAAAPPVADSQRVSAGDPADPSQAVPRGGLDLRL